MDAVFVAANQSDGILPINESATLVLAGLRPGHIQSDQVAAAVVDDRDHTIQLAVHPDHRREGHGSALLASLLETHPDYQVWAFGSLPGSAELAKRIGLTSTRTLLQMERPLTERTPLPASSDTFIRPFEDADADAIVAINAAAFAHHPEQGKMTRAEFDDLRAQPWFDAAGLLVSTIGDELTGFHWTKRHQNDVGEVYVLAVAPEHKGRGLGRALLEAGVHYLEDEGASRVQLFVEACEEPVVRMYERAGFRTVRKDTSYGRTR